MAPIQEKIAKSLQPHEQNLAGSQYGKYFVRNMNSLLLKREPEAWRTRQASNKEASISPPDGQAKSVPISSPEKSSEKPSTEVPPKLPSKRGKGEGDDIDKLFDSALGKKRKRSALPSAREDRKAPTNPEATGLESILGAIRDAPKGEKEKRHKKKKAG